MEKTDRKKTDKKKSSNSRWKWLNQIYNDIDKLKVKQKELELDIVGLKNEIQELRDIVNLDKESD